MALTGVAIPIYLELPGEGSEVVYLERWSIREFDNGERRFVGFSRQTRDGRMSAPIVELDAEDAEAVQRAGGFII